jgi:small multidrug resistance pump
MKACADAIRAWAVYRLDGKVAPMPAALLLALAIMVEVAATLALRAADGFTRLLPSVGVVAGYATAFFLLGLVLRSIPVSIAYAVWSAVGTGTIALIGMTVLDEPAGAIRIISLVLILVGVMGLNLAGGTN